MSRNPGTPPGASGSSSEILLDYEDEVEDEEEDPNDSRRFNFFRAFRDEIVKLINKLYKRQDRILMWMLYLDRESFDELRQHVIDQYAEKYFPESQLDHKNAYSYSDGIERLKIFANVDLIHLVDPLYARIKFVFAHHGAAAPIEIMQGELEPGQKCYICHGHLRDEDKDAREKRNDALAAQAQPGRLRYIVATCNNQHHFHSVCLYSWLNGTRSCPFCRANVTNMQLLLDKRIRLREQVPGLQASFLVHLGILEQMARDNIDSVIDVLTQVQEKVSRDAEEVERTRSWEQENQAIYNAMRNQFYASI